jgi:TPP-dependent pyruvate/acetoin dehydrogenase alpha subunit
VLVESTFSMVVLGLAVVVLLGSIAARLRARSLTDGPTLVESVTYRQGFHTSSDNPDLYRTGEEAAAWAEWDPIHRARRFLERRGAWDADQEDALVAGQRDAIRDAIHTAEQLPKPGPEDQFHDVLATPDRAMLEQLAQLTADLKGAAR